MYRINIVNHSGHIKQIVQKIITKNLQQKEVTT